MRWAGVVGGVVGVLLFVGPVAASPVTFEFAGEITWIGDNTDLLGGAVTIGSPFSGLYTFESTTPDSFPNRSNHGLYLDAVTFVSGQIGDLAFVGSQGPRNYLQVRDRARGFSDVYRVRDEVSFAEETLHFFLDFRDRRSAVFSSDVLLLVPPDLDLFTSANLLMFVGSEGTRLGLCGRVTSLVPEPATLVLLALGACISLKPRRRRGRKAGRRA